VKPVPVRGHGVRERVATGPALIVVYRDRENAKADLRSRISGPSLPHQSNVPENVPTASDHGLLWANAS
jgi:hypothetical protein